MGIEFLIKRDYVINFVKNLLKTICEDYSLNNNKTTTHWTHSNNNRRKQNTAQREQKLVRLTQVNKTQVNKTQVNKTQVNKTQASENAMLKKRLVF